jgi:hypothetical protein
MTTRLLGVSGDNHLPVEEAASCTSLVPVSRALTPRNGAVGDTDGYTGSVSSVSDDSSWGGAKALEASGSRSGPDQVTDLSPENVIRLSGGLPPTSHAATQYWFYANMLGAQYPHQVNLYV